MGWTEEDLPGHEGHAVGMVEAADRAGLLKELGYPDVEERPVDAVAAACACGWRSPRWRPEHERGPTLYRPYSVGLGPVDDERVYRLVVEHFADVRRRRAAGLEPHDPLAVEPHWDVAGALPSRVAHAG